jgi:hypothetical protein
VARRSTGKSNDPEADDCSDPLFAEYRALIIGIGEYSDRNIEPLLEPTKDVEKLRKTLGTIGYASGQVQCLCDAEATFEAIRAELCQMGSMKQRVPVLLVFWAGHGIANSYGESFLLSHDTELNQFDRKAFPIDELISLVRSANARDKVIFLDTCFAIPSSERLFLPAWHRLDLVNAPPSLAFAGASTYFAIEQAGSGGILASCLREALTDHDSNLCDEKGRIYLHSVMHYLQQHVRDRASEVWRRTDLPGEGPQEPYFSFRPGKPVVVGRNVARHVTNCVEFSDLPDPVRKLAKMVIAHHWPGGKR